MKFPIMSLFCDGCPSKVDTRWKNPSFDILTSVFYFTYYWSIVVNDFNKMENTSCALCKNQLMLILIQCQFGWVVSAGFTSGIVWGWFLGWMRTIKGHTHFLVCLTLKDFMSIDQKCPLYTLMCLYNSFWVVQHCTCVSIWRSVCARVA